jgi:hypothetical protein
MAENISHTVYLRRIMQEITIVNPEEWLHFDNKQQLPKDLIEQIQLIGSVREQETRTCILG